MSSAAPAPPTLRVMRLYKPKLHTQKRGGMPGAMRLTSALVLPDSFGSIYKGQTFVAYVSVLNAEEAPAPELLDVVVSAKLQAPSAKRAVELKDVSAARVAAARKEGYDPDSWRTPEMGKRKRKDNPAARVDPGENVDMIVEHGLAECGTHTLRVSVSYRLPGDASSDADGKAPEPRSLRKFYRFNVAEPLEISSDAWLLPRPSFDSASSRYATPESLSDEPALGVVEVSVKNSMADRCILEALTLHAPSGFAAREVKAEGGRIKVTRGGATPPPPDTAFLDAFEKLVKENPGPYGPDFVPPEAPADGFEGSALDLDADSLKDLMDFDPLALYDAKTHLEPEDCVSRIFTVHRAARPAKFLTGDDDSEPAADGDDGSLEMAPANAGWLKATWVVAMGEGGSIATPAVDWRRADAAELAAALAAADKAEEEAPSAEGVPERRRTAGDVAHPPLETSSRGRGRSCPRTRARRTATWSRWSCGACRAAASCRSWRRFGASVA